MTLDVQKNYDRDVPYTADVCIIGSGAGGSVVAYELTKQGKKVVMLEAGNHYTEEDITSQTRDDVLLNLWKNHGIFLSNNFSVNVAQGQCVGGSTMINYGICFRFPDFVKKIWQEQYGVQLTDQEIDSAYGKAEMQYGVTGITQEGRSHDVIGDGCDVLGYSHGWMSKALRGGKKQNALNAYLEKADHSKLKIFANCKAESIEQSGNTMTKVWGIATDPDTKLKHKVSVTAQKFVLAAGPIASSEFLLKNNTANSSGQVGKNFSLHPSSSVVGVFDESINGQDSSVMAYFCDEFSARRHEKFGFMIESVFVSPSQFSLIMPHFGQKNLEEVKKYHNVSMIGVLVHDQAVGQVKLNHNQDATLDYSLSENDQKQMVKGMQEACMIYLRAGAREVITGHIETTIIKSEDEIESKIKPDSAGQGKLLIASAHPQGGNIMGSDPAKSVVDSYCKSHDISNLYICDASVFPTSVGVNPQLTVLMLATIAAEHMC